MKSILTILMSMIFLCLVGCQEITPIDKLEQEITYNIPILVCDFDTKNISIGEWDLSSNEFVISQNSHVGTTEDPYTLYSLHWNGERGISGLQVYLEEINNFSNEMELRTFNYGEIINDDVCITTSNENRIVYSDGNKSVDIPYSNEIIEKTGEITPDMLGGACLYVDKENAFYLQSVISEKGVYLVCFVINIQSLAAESYLVDVNSDIYGELEGGIFGTDTFATGNGRTYFYTRDAVYAFNPEKKNVSQLITLDDLNLISENKDTRFQISGVNLYGENIIIECAEYVRDIPHSKTSVLCSTSGEVYRSKNWDCNKKLIVFPKS